MITKIASGEYGTAVYLIDTAAEVSNLSNYKGGIGSAALCVEDGKVYMLNGSKEWVEFGGDSNEV